MVESQVVVSAATELIDLQEVVTRCTVTFYVSLCQINVIEGVKLALKEH